jgi:hypothetical protein
MVAPRGHTWGTRLRLSLPPATETHAVPLASGSRSRHPLACVGIALSSSSAEFSERLGHERVGHEHTRKPGITVSPGGDSAQDRAAVILTPDQRVRVFISSTLEELAEERAAALRAIRRLHLVLVWFKSGVRPHPPQSMDRAYLEQSQIFVGIYWQRYGWVGPGHGDLGSGG